MKVYVVTECGSYGEDKEIHSVWDTHEKATAEMFRVEQNLFGVSIEEWEINRKGRDDC